MTSFLTLDPATEEVLASVAQSTSSDVRNAVKEAQNSLESWSKTPLSERVAILLSFAQLVESNREELSALVTREQGKILAEATAEVADSAHRVRFFCERAPVVLAGETLEFNDMAARVDHAPVGVVGAIKPWNFPFGIPLWTLVPALLAGNPVVFKPSELTPLVGQRIVELLHEGGVPPGVLHLVQGQDEIGKALAASEVRLIGFVGSQEVGAKIMREAANDMKRLSLEMGGKDPMLILADAEVEKVSRGAVNGAFKNCGQICCSVERVYVHSSIFQSFVESVVESVRNLRIGPGMEPGIDIGPLVSEAQRERTRSLVEDARNSGARILTGGRRIDREGFFFEPTVVTSVPHSAVMFATETFGPILQIEPFESEDEAVNLANALPFGLTASVWSRDIERAISLANRLQAGTRAVNQNTGSRVELPWGGVKSSGIGRMLSDEGILEFTETITTRVPLS
jgi:acyl-CoA reductase-like NAD-dependent aldehyde dehydrogenase